MSPLSLDYNHCSTVMQKDTLVKVEETKWHLPRYLFCITVQDIIIKFVKK